MAEALYVLREIVDTYDSLEDIHKSAIEGLINEYQDEFAYLDEWDARDGGASFFGKDDPGKMRSYAAAWNPRLNSELRRALEDVQKDMADKGYDDFTNYVADDRWGVRTYAFRKALNASTGHFQYGHHHVAHTEYSGWTTVLSDKDIENINAHPENYAVVLCWYH